MAVGSSSRTATTSSRKALTTPAAFSDAAFSGPGRDAGLSVLLRIGVGQGVGKPGCPEAGDEAVFLSGKEGDFRVGRFCPAGVDFGADPFAFARRNPAGPPVGDQAVFQRGEVSPGDEVALLHFDIRTQGFQDAPTEPVAERIVAEEGQVGRPAAGRDAHPDGVGHPAAALLGQPVEIRGPRGFQFRPAVLRQAAQPVDDEKDDFRIGGEGQFPGHFFPVHVVSPRERSGSL